MINIKPLIWVDNKEGTGATARVAIFDEDAKEEDHPTTYFVCCATWWLDPSWSSPKIVGYWNGDLGPAKAAAQADYEARIRRALA